MKASELLKQLEEELTREGITVKIKTGDDINKKAEELFSRVEKITANNTGDNNAGGDEEE